MIKYLILDVEGILISKNGPEQIEKIEKEGINVPKFRSKVIIPSSKPNYTIMDLMDKNEINFEKFLQEEVDHFSEKKLTVEEFAQIMLKHRIINKELIEYCKNKKIEVGILSNYYKGADKILTEILKLKEWTKEIIFSCQVNTVKPEPKIYEEILERLEAKPEECLFIDDKKPNIEGAKKLGINTIHWMYNGRNGKEIVEKLEQHF